MDTNTVKVIMKHYKVIINQTLINFVGILSGSTLYIKVPLMGYQSMETYIFVLELEFRLSKGGTNLFIGISII